MVDLTVKMASDFYSCELNMKVIHITMNIKSCMPQKEITGSIMIIVRIIISHNKLDIINGNQYLLIIKLIFKAHFALLSLILNMLMTDRCLPVINLHVDSYHFHTLTAKDELESADKYLNLDLLLYHHPPFNKSAIP